MENNLAQSKEVDITFSLFIMNKMELYLENNSWILLSPITTVGSYSKNKLIIQATFSNSEKLPKIIINNSPEFYYGRLKKHWLQSDAAVSISFDNALSTARLLNAALYECVDIEIVI